MAEEKTRMKTIGVAVLGTGWVAGEHIKSYGKRADCRVVALCSRTREGAEAKARETGLTDARIYDSYEAMLADPEIDAVSICTPPNNHPQETILAAQAGKHLLIEKAVANDPASLGTMLRAVESAGVKTVVSFVLHWNPQFQWIKRMLQEQAIGDLFYAEVDYWHNIGPQYGQYRWNVKKEIAGSVWLSAGCHAVDAMRAFVRDEIVEVTAYGNKRNPEYEYDTNVVGIVKFAGGAIGKLSASFDVACPYAFNIDLLGDKGAIRDKSHLRAAVLRWTDRLDHGPYHPSRQRRRRPPSLRRRDRPLPRLHPARPRILRQPRRRREDPRGLLRPGTQLQSGPFCRPGGGLFLHARIMCEMERTLDLPGSFSCLWAARAA